MWSRGFGALASRSILVWIDGADSGLGPYSFRPGVPPFMYDASIVTNLKPLPAHNISSLIPSGENNVLFELLDTQRAIFGHTPVYLVRDCGIWLDKNPVGQTHINWMSWQVEVGGAQSNIDVVSGKTSEWNLRVSHRLRQFVAGIAYRTSADNTVSLTGDRPAVAHWTRASP